MALGSRLIVDEDKLSLCKCVDVFGYRRDGHIQSFAYFQKIHGQILQKRKHFKPVRRRKGAAQPRYVFMLSGLVNRKNEIFVGVKNIAHVYSPSLSVFRA